MLIDSVITFSLLKLIDPAFGIEFETFGPSDELQ